MSKKVSMLFYFILIQFIAFFISVYLWISCLLQTCMNPMTTPMKQEIILHLNKIDGLKEILLQLQRLPFSPAVQHEIIRIENVILGHKNHILNIYNRCYFHPLDIELLWISRFLVNKSFRKINILSLSCSWKEPELISTLKVSVY